ncbi:MAG: TniQ family protein [Terracidiphilus sp.]
MAPEELYETWHLDGWPDIPERSRFYPLLPIGIGTPDVESLTGYVARLAEAHVLSVGDMVGRDPVSALCGGLPRRARWLRQTRSKGHAFHAYSYAINGTARTAQSWVRTFKRITRVSSMKLLTLLPLRLTLSDMSLFRRHRAWCPHCYEEDLRNGVAYERLLWSLQTVTVCPKHTVPLEHECPFCNCALPPLSVRSRPGHCSACGDWLGRKKSAASAFSEMGEDQFEFYKAPAVGDLLAGLNYGGRVQVARFRRNLRTCIRRLTAGNGDAFAEITHTPRTTLRTWLNVGLPRLDVLLHFAFYLGISVKDLLMSRSLPEADWAEVKSRIPNNERNAKCYRTSETVRKLLEAALQDDDCPSVPELAKQLGYKRSERLRQVSPDICHRLTKRHRACHRTHWWREPGAKRIAELEHIRSLLEQSLRRDPPISVRRIATQLGYSGGNAGFIVRCFPDLCRSIRKRLEERKARRKEEVRRIVSAAISEQPPPTLHELSQRFGFQTSTTLRAGAPDLADLLLKRRAEYAAEKEELLREALSRVLQENPAPSLNSVARRLQRSAAFLREHHIDLCHAIASRCLQQRKLPARNRRKSSDDVLQSQKATLSFPETAYSGFVSACEVSASA